MLAASHHLNENAKWFLASIQLQIKTVLVFVGCRVHEELENKRCLATEKESVCVSNVQDNWKTLLSDFVTRRINGFKVLQIFSANKTCVFRMIFLSQTLDSSKSSRDKLCLI